MGEFGEFLEFVPRLGVEDALSGVDDGVFGGEQQAGRLADVLGIAGGAARLDGRVGERVGGGVAAEDVGGEF